MCYRFILGSVELHDNAFWNGSLSSVAFVLSYSLVYLRGWSNPINWR